MPENVNEQLKPPLSSEAIGLRVRQMPGTESIPVMTSPTLTKEWLQEMRFQHRKAPVRSSSYKALRTCFRRFLFEYRLGLKTIGYDSALETGIMWHKLLEMVYRGTPVDQLPHIVVRHLPELHDKLQPKTDRLGMLPNGKSFLDVMTQAQQDADKALAMACVYLDYYPVPSVLENYEVAEIEGFHAIEMPGVPVPLVVRIDLLLRNKYTGQLWITDYKTTSKPPVVRAQTLPFEFQPNFYKFVLYNSLELQRFETDPEARLKPSVSIGGVMHHIIRKPGIRFCRKDKDFAAYIQRVREWYRDEAAKDPKNPPVLCSVIPHSGPYLTGDLMNQIAEHVRFSVRKLQLDKFHRNEDACFKWNKPCPFLQLCRTEYRVEAWESVIREHYVQEFRDDMEQQNEEENE